MKGTPMPMQRLVRRLLAFIFLLLTATLTSFAAPATVYTHPALGPIPAGAQFDSSGQLDPEIATRAYLDSLPAAKRAASDKYFQGGYWLILWDALYSIAICLLLLFSGASVRMRDLTARLTRFAFLRTWLYFIGFTLATTVLGAPLTWYEGYYREHMYNQSNQSLSGWLHDQSISLALGLILAGLVVSVLYALVRRLPNTWHLWGTGVSMFFFILTVMVGPVYLAPLFNTYSTIQDPAVNGPILRMAHANGIGVDKLVQVDASKQTTQVSANVSGIFGTTRITLNDNLLRTASIPEIEAVTGHEMGHYVLNHIDKGMLEALVTVFLFFCILRAWLGSMQRRHGARWHTTGVADVALLPAVVLAITVIGLLTTPLTKTLTRTQEFEADMYGINASRQPDGFAQAMLKLSTYRKLEPTPLEEFIFYDHPSGHTRIRAAMGWKSQNANTVLNCAGYPDAK